MLNSKYLGWLVGGLLIFNTTRINAIGVSFCKNPLVNNVLDNQTYIEAYYVLDTVLSSLWMLILLVLTTVLRTRCYIIIPIRQMGKLRHSSVQFSHSVMSNSLRPHGLQHARFPCPSPTPGACSNSCPLSQWCHPTISSSVAPFSSCLQSFPASGSFLMSQLFVSGGQSTEVSASASVLPMNIQDDFL